MIATAMIVLSNYLQAIFSHPSRNPVSSRKLQSSASFVFARRSIECSHSDLQLWKPLFSNPGVHYDGLQRDEFSIKQQSCNTYFNSPYFAEDKGSLVLSRLRKMEIDRPVLAPWARVGSLKGDYVFVVLCQSLSGEISTSEQLIEKLANRVWWIHQAIQFGVSVKAVQTRRQLGLVLQQLGANRQIQRIILTTPCSHLFVTNFLLELDRLKERSEIDYSGFPFAETTWFKKRVFAALEAGIVVSKRAAVILSSHFLATSETGSSVSIDIEIGRVLKEFDLHDLLGLNPEPPEAMLRYLDDPATLPSHHTRPEPLATSIGIPLLSFGGRMDVNSMIRFEKIVRIPKILHQVWVGDQSKRPPETNECRRVYETAGWKYRLWTDENEDELLNELLSPRLYSRTEELNSKGDIVRTEALFRFGGLGMDADSICLRTCDDLIEDAFASSSMMFAACESEEKREGLIAAGIQAVAPSTLGYYNIIRASHLVENVDVLYRERAAVGWITTGPVFFTRCIHSFGLPAMILNSRKFFPLHWTELSEIADSDSFDIAAQVIDEIVAEHWSYTIQFWGTTARNFYDDHLKIEQ